MSSQVTIKDLARMLGVSPSTISRSLNNHPDISEETRNQVLELAKKLNYQPNTTAQKLRSQKTKTIGVVIPEIVHFFFSTVVSGIEDAADKAGYRIMFCQSMESYEKEVGHIQSLLAHRVDGLLVSMAKYTQNFDHFHEATKNEVPIVYFDRKMDDITATNVLVEDYPGAKSATQHLIDQGCKRIAHVSAPKNLSIGQERTQGYLDALHENGLPFDKKLLLDDRGGSKESGIECAKYLLGLDEVPDGIFANNDMVAFGIMEEVKNAGLKIPKDIAVVGFSDWMLAGLIEPKLTSVSQPGFELGKVATEKLIQEMNAKGDIIHETIKLPTKLVVRKSSMKSKDSQPSAEV